MNIGIEPRVGTGNRRGFGVGFGREIACGARFGLGYGCRRLKERRLSAGADQETLSQEKAMLLRRLERVTSELNSLSIKDK